MSKMKIAITGNMGSGKSTVLNLIKEKNYKVLDVDKINANNLEKKIVRKTIREMLGLKRFTKKQVSKIIFSDDQKRISLEEYLYPLIIAELKKLNDNEIYFVEVPLLFEKNWMYLFDYSVLVYSTNQQMVHRLTTDRGYEVEEARARLDKQMNIEDKMKLADYVIDNQGTLNQLEDKVNDMISKLIDKKL